jgi:nucleoside-diphosphate-sugar epimerase
MSFQANNDRAEWAATAPTTPRVPAVRPAAVVEGVKESRQPQRYLVTGGAGFLGSLLVEDLARHGHQVTILDRVNDADLARRFRFAHADLRAPEQVEGAFRQFGPFDGVFHVAAMLAHAIEDKRDLVDSNVNGTRNIVEAATRNGVPQLVYTSSNCVVGKPFSQPVKEEDPINPLEVYGVSKWDGEKVLAEYQDRIDISMIRPPTIMAGGRLGLLSILYEFIYEGRKVWMLGSGSNRYQFIYANDLIDAMERAIYQPGFHLYNIGSDNVPSLRDLYNKVIKHAGTKARVASLPKAPAVAAMRVLHVLGMSPLGPYHYKMLAEDFIFDTSRIKRELGWRPTKTNTEMLVESYDWYVQHFDDIYSGGERSAHRQPVKLQALALVKRFS